MKVMITLKLSLLVFAVILFFGTMIFLRTISNNLKEPKVLVENMTVLTKSDLFYDYEITKYPSKVEVIDLKSGKKRNVIGISTDLIIFNFGIMPVGENQVIKTMTFNKTDDMKVKVNLVAFGNISDMISFSKNNFYLNDEDKVFVFLNLTENTHLGNYTGEIDAIIKKEKR